MGDIIDPAAAAAALGQITKATGWVLSVLKACPSWVAGLGPKALGERISAHKVRTGLVDAAVAYLKAEAESIAEVRGELRKRAALEQNPVEQARLRHELQLTECDGRVIDVIRMATQAAPRLGGGQPPSEKSAGDDKQAGPEISDAWIDRFRELAQLRQEPWRQTLLARALRAESERPGSIGLRTLWTIGTMDSVHFSALEQVGSIAARLDSWETLVVEHVLLDRPLDETLAVERDKASSAVWLCLEAGLMQEGSNHMTANEAVQVRYGTELRTYQVGTNPTALSGYLSTYVGTQLGRLCDFALSNLGRINFDHIGSTLGAAGAQRTS